MANNQLLASDSFVSGSLAASWAAVHSFSVCQVTGSPKVTEPNALSTTAGQIWTGITWPNDQISEVKIQALTAEAGTYIVPCVRYQTATDSGYRVNLTNNTAVLNRIDNGTPTQIGSTVSGLTIAAGDVWSFQAGGACLSLYQNGKLILVNFDTTYTSGSPGFLQFSSVNIAHTQVGAWRGYSVVQQDGIWQKQGIVIPALATDTLSSGIGAWINSTVLYEGNAQVLFGTVFKMWFNAGNNIGYAESLDGISWTRHTNVISTFSVPMVMKVGSIYYLYAQVGSGGNTAFHAFTSTDGISWTDHGDTGIALGGVGAWDHVFIYSLQPVDIIAGTWYALYTAGNNSVANFLGSIGLATSSDGLSWTKYGGNPVVGGYWNSQAIAKIGGTYYMWCEANQLGRGNAPAAGLDPTETVRIQSTDLINWTNPVHSIHNSQMYESLNTNNGQAFPNAIINVGGKAYLYYTADPSDNLAPHVYQIGLAIGPAPIQSIITANEDGVQQTASDGFTNGTGPLSANWTVPTGGGVPKIVAGPLVEPTLTATASYAAYTGASFANDQYSEVTLHTLTANGSDYAFPIVRCATGALTFYQAQLTATMGSAAIVQVDKVVSNVSTIIGPTPIITPQVGDVIRLSVVTVNGLPVLSIFQNGFMLLQVVDYSNAITTGNPGFALFASTNITHAQISSWAGGNANVIPVYPSLGTGWSPVDSRQAVKGFGPAANTGIVDAQGNVIYSAQDPPFTGNSQVSDNAAIPPIDSRKAGAPVDSRAKVPVNSRVAPPFKS